MRSLFCIRGRKGAAGMKKQYLETGEIVTTHGLKGEVRVLPWSDSPEFLCNFSCFYLDKNGTRRMETEQVRTNKNMVLVKFAGVDTVEDALRLRGKTLYVNRDDCPEGDGWFVQDLIGLAVYNADSGECYGTLSDVLQTGANDVYQISAPGKADKLIPAIPQVVLSVDVDGGRMEIRPLEGLFDED